MTRKTPIRHQVKPHVRNRRNVRTYPRGQGSKLQTITTGAGRGVTKQRMVWFERTERKAIVNQGGTHKNIIDQQDGEIKGRPVDVKAVRKDNRFRIDEDNHAFLVNNGGAYIFVDNHGNEKKLSAVKVDRLLSSGPFFKDRVYPHKFVTVKQIFL